MTSDDGSIRYVIEVSILPADCHAEIKKFEKEFKVQAPYEDTELKVSTH